MENEVEMKKTSQSGDFAAENVDNKSVVNRKPKSEAAISGQVATYTLLFLFVFVGILVWISG